MLEVVGTIAIIVLIAREFLAIEAGPAPRLLARLVGWGVVPLVLLFAVLFAMRVLAFLGGT
jgi:hypothetical protein